MEKAFIRFKLDYLKKQRDELHSLLDTEVDKVLHKGDVWLQGTADNQDCVSYTFKQISNAIEQTVVFLGQKYSELSKIKVTFDMNDTTESSGQSQDVYPTSSQVMKPCGNFSAESELTTKRLERLEEAVTTLTTKMNSVTEERKCLKETKLKQESESEETTFHWHSLEKDLESLKKEMKEIKQKVHNVEVGCDYGKAFESLGHRVDKFESLQADLQKVEILEQKVEELKGLKKEVNELKSTLASSKHQSFAHTLEKLDKMQMKVDEIGKKADKTDDLKERIDNIENLHERIEEYESGVKEIQKLNRINEGRLEHLECVTNSLSTKGEEIISNIQTLNQTTATTETALRDIISSQERERTALTELQKKLNSNVKYRDKNISKLHDVVKRVAELEPRILQVEVQNAKKPVVGFTGSIHNAQNPVKGRVVNQFTTIVSNTMDCYNPDTGEFTAPVDGLYGVSLSLWQWHEGDIALNVKSTCFPNPYDPSYAETNVICVCNTCNHHSSDTAFAVTELQAGDKLYVVVSDVNKRPRMSSGTSFSCFLIAQSFPK